MAKVVIMILSALVLSWSSGNSKAPAVASFRENAMQWIDLCGLANSLSLPMQWNLSARRLEVGNDDSQVAWSQGIPFAASHDSAQRIETSPRLFKGTWWTPMKSTLGILGNQLGDSLTWDSLTHEVHLMAEKTVTSIKLNTKASTDQVSIHLNRRIDYSTSLHPPSFEVCMPGVHIDSTMLGRIHPGTQIKSIKIKQKSDTLRLIFSLADGIDNAEIIEKDSGLVLQLQVRKNDTTDTVTAKADNTRPLGKVIHTIIIDPGHGGKDPGAIGKIAMEKDIALEVGRKLRDKLRKNGFAAKMTRDDDHFVELKDRPAQASKWNGDIFISLHCNAVEGTEHRKKTNGFRVYILREAESEEDKAIARRENTAAELSSNKSKADITPVEWILLDNQLNQYTKKSEKLAEILVNTYQGGEIRKMGSGAGQAGFMVLVGAFMPAVLVELGFITHPEDEAYLVSEKGQDEIAERIAKSILQYRDLRE